MVRRCWVNFQSRGVLLIWIIVGQGPIALVAGAGGGCLDIFFSLIYHFSFSISLGTAWYRLKYCLKGPFSLKQPNRKSFTVTLISRFPCTAQALFSPRFQTFENIIVDLT